MSNIFVDYKKQRRAFYKLCNPQCKKKIILFEGVSGAGKTALLRYCKKRIPTGIEHISFDCKSTTISISEIFSRSAHKLGWQRLAEFQKSVSLYSNSNINVKNMKQQGDKNKIDIALSAENAIEIKDRQILLTDSWFRDIQKLKNQLLIIIDTYEEAIDETSKWLRGPFLWRVANTINIRVVIAGKNTPDPHNIEWGDHSKLYSLPGIKDAQEWMLVVQDKQRYINKDNPMSWLTRVCDELEGNPDRIMKFIEGLPFRKGILWKKTSTNL